MYTLFDDLKGFLVLGHRGYSEKYPENTMMSFDACAENEMIDGIELDVHLCKSGEIVVAHDGNLKRCAGIDRFIEDMTWDELKDIDVGSFKASEFSSARMPLLEELFEKYGARFCYDIELKVEKGRKYKKLCRKVWDMICDYNLQERVMVSSFHPFALRYFNHYCVMSIPTADIFSKDPVVPKYLQTGKGHLISKSSYLKPDFTQITQEYIDTHKLPVIAWTVNDIPEARRLASLKGVIGLIGNNPEILASIKK